MTTSPHADVLQAGLQWLADELANSASQTVVIQRGNTSIDSTGTLGKGRIAVESAGGGFLVVETDDWTIPASAWDALTPDEPVRGDKIVATVAGESRTYEVLPADGEHCYQDLGARGVLYQVHTKRRQ